MKKTDNKPTASAPVMALKDRVVAEVVALFPVTAEDLSGTSRRAHIAEARMVAVAMVHEFSGSTLSETGRAFGRAHDQVAHSVRRVNELCSVDNRLLGRVEKIRMALLMESTEPKPEDPLGYVVHEALGNWMIQDVAMGRMICMSTRERDARFIADALNAYRPNA